MDVGQWMSANHLKFNSDKTELIWVWSKHKLSQLAGILPDLQLASDVIATSD